MPGQPLASSPAPAVYPQGFNRQIHGLRGLSAWLVFLFHVYGMGVLWGFWPVHYVASFAWMDFARHGVEIFFVISGYLITASVIRHGDARRFLIDRCIRIYPVFLTIQLVVFGLGPIVGYKWLNGIGLADWLRAFVENALFLPGLFDLPLAQLNAWSLSYEAAFYLLSAAAFMGARSLGRRASGALLIAVVSPLLWLYPQASFFVVGALCYRLHGVVPPAVVRAASPLWLAAALTLLTLGEGGRLLTYAACVPGLLLFLSIRDGRCPVSALLRAAPLQYLGTISYSFYLWSPTVTYPIKLAMVGVLSDGTDSFVPMAVFLVAGFAVSIAVSHVSYLVLEEGAGRRLRAWFEARRTRPNWGEEAVT